MPKQLSHVTLDLISRSAASFDESAVEFEEKAAHHLQLAENAGAEAARCRENARQLREDAVDNYEADAEHALDHINE
jgi:hypothetical protein